MMMLMMIFPSKLNRSLSLYSPLLSIVKTPSDIEQSLLSFLLVALRLIVRVRAAVHVEVVGIASERSARVEDFLIVLSRSLLICRLVEHLADHGSE